MCLKNRNKNARRSFVTAMLALFLLMVPTLASGDLVLLRDNGEIWRYTGPPCTAATICPGWVLIDTGKDRPTQIAAQLGTFTGPSLLFQRHEDGSIWTWDGQGRCDDARKVCPGWTRINADKRTKDIVASRTTVFGRFADGSVSKWDGQPQSHCDDLGNCPGWTLINSDPHISEIVAGIDSRMLFMRQDNGAVWTWDGQPQSHCDDLGKVCPGWTRINADKRTKEIAAGGGDSFSGQRLYQRLADGSVWKWDGQPQSHCDDLGKVCPGWTRINNDKRTEDIVASDSTVFQRLADGSVWKWDGQPQSHCDDLGKVCPGWTRINNDRTKVIVASAFTVFQLQGDGGVWKWDGQGRCDPDGKVCPGWAPPLDRDPSIKAIVPFDQFFPSPTGPKPPG
jgi:hypothetical protein